MGNIKTLLLLYDGDGKIPRNSLFTRTFQKKKETANRSQNNVNNNFDYLTDDDGEVKNKKKIKVQ